MDGMAGSRERDVPSKLAQLNSRIEEYGKLVAELRERTKPVASQAPTLNSVKQGTPATPSLTPLGGEILESINRIVSLNNSLEEVIHSIEV